MPIGQRAEVNGVHAQFLDPGARANDIRDGIQRADFMEANGFDRLPMNLCLRDRDAMKDAQRVRFNEVRKLAPFEHRPDVRIGAPRRRLVVVFVAVVVVMIMVMMLMLMLVRILVSVIVIMLPMGMLVLVFVFGMFMSMVVVMMFVRMGMLVVLFILVMRMRRAGMNAEFDPFDLPLLPAFEVHVEIAEVELGQFPLERGRIDAQVAQRADSHVAADARGTIEEENAQGGKDEG
jgi:hypothetical protein